MAVASGEGVLEAVHLPTKMPRPNAQAKKAINLTGVRSGIGRSFDTHSGGAHEGRRRGLCSGGRWTGMSTGGVGRLASGEVASCRVRLFRCCVWRRNYGYVDRCGST